MTNEPMTPLIPEFTSYDEEAAWWDSHDITEYLHELKPVTVRVAKHLSESLNIRLDHGTMVSLRQQAQKQGIGPTTLARMWIKERLTETARQHR